jgi:hypothetical protein
MHVEGKASPAALQDLMCKATITSANIAHIAVPDTFPDEGDDQSEMALITGYFLVLSHTHHLAPMTQLS